MAVEEIVSGGQTGADRAALDVALALGIRCGGWVPAGRAAEDGVIPERYPNLKETESGERAVRTELNVRDSDATLILSRGELAGGSKLTSEIATRMHKPVKHIDLASYTSVQGAITEGRAWLGAEQPRKLNVAGPTAREDTDIYSRAVMVLTGILAEQPRMSRDEGLQVAMELRQATVSWLQHWDNVRWQVPYWFCTIATATVGAVAFLWKPELAEPLKVVCLLFGLFGLCCTLLLVNLVRYHRAAHGMYRRAVEELNLEPRLRAAVNISDPFHFDWRIVLTATFWFGLYTGALTILSFVTLWRGVWWK